MNTQVTKKPSLPLSDVMIHSAMACSFLSSFVGIVPAFSVCFLGRRGEQRIIRNYGQVFICNNNQNTWTLPFPNIVNTMFGNHLDREQFSN